MSKPILSVDFDGVIHSYSSGWQGVDVIPDPPVPGAIDFLRRASEHFTVAIYSSRSHQTGGLNAMQQYIAEHAHDIRQYPHVQPGDVIDTTWMHRLLWPTNKPSAFLSIDDRALQFTGHWPEIAEMQAFQPWNKRVTPKVPI